MQISRLPIALALICAPTALAAHVLPEPGIWTNTEDEYFAEEEGREPVEWLALEIADDGKWRRIDAFGDAQSEWSDAAIPDLSRNNEGDWQIGASEIRLASPVSCWVSVKRDTPAADGSEDWSYASGLMTFDQGGRILVPGSGTAPDVTVRIRNVTWAEGSPNKPALVLYIHKQDPVLAEIYSWASPDATLIGVNLRWVQASCSPIEE